MPPNGRQENRPHRLRDFYGDLPTYGDGVNKGRLMRKQVAELFNITGKQLTKAYLNWQDIFRIPGSDLTFCEYLEKMRDSGLNPDQIGTSNKGFNLSRIDDSGPYTKGRCRFLPRLDNIAEQKNLFGKGART